MIASKFSLPSSRQTINASVIARTARPVEMVGMKAIPENWRQIGRLGTPGGTFSVDDLIRAVPQMTNIAVLSGEQVEFHLDHLGGVLDVRVVDDAPLRVLQRAAHVGDRIGHRTLYQMGQAVFLLASIGTLAVTNLPTLLIVRTLQALGAAQRRSYELLAREFGM